MFDIFETLFSQLLNRRAFESPFVMLFVNLSIVIKYEMTNKKYRGNKSYDDKLEEMCTVLFLC